MTVRSIDENSLSIKRYKIPDDIKSYFKPHEEYVECLNDEKATYYFNKVRQILKKREELNKINGT